MSFFLNKLLITAIQLIPLLVSNSIFSRLIPPIATIGILKFFKTKVMKSNEAIGAFGFVVVGKHAPNATYVTPLSTAFLTRSIEL